MYLMCNFAWNPYDSRWITTTNINSTIIILIDEVIYDSKWQIVLRLWRRRPRQMCKRCIAVKSILDTAVHIIMLNIVNNDTAIQEHQLCELLCSFSSGRWSIVCAAILCITEVIRSTVQFFFCFKQKSQIANYHYLVSPHICRVTKEKKEEERK